MLVSRLPSKEWPSIPRAGTTTLPLLLVATTHQAIPVLILDGVALTKQLNMAKGLYVPNPMALLGRPRYQAPQNTSGIQALASGLNAITDVANNWRQKQQSVEAAKRTADALEKEGMTSEANLYRAAADNFSVNFFATPAENQKFNQGLITDTLKLLEAKQKRDLQEAHYRAMEEQRRATFQDRILDRKRADERLQMERENFQSNLNQKEEAGKDRVLQRQEGFLVSQLGQLNKEEQDLYRQRRAGAISQDEYATQLGKPGGVLERKSTIQQSLDRLQRAALGDQAVGLPTIPSSPGRISTVQSQAEEDEEMASAAQAYAEKNGKKFPALKELPFRGKAVANPYYSGTVSTRTGVDAKGNPYESTTTTAPAGAITPSGLPTDPTLNLE